MTAPDRCALVEQAIRQFVDAMREVERLGICGIDVDIPTDEEQDAIRELIRVMQNYALNYNEDGPQLRLSNELEALLAALTASVSTAQVQALVEQFYKDEGDGIDGRLYRCKVCEKGWSVNGTFSTGPQHHQPCPVDGLARLIAEPQPGAEK